MQEWGKFGHKGDFGWSGIASTHFFISPKEDLIVIIMSQQSPFSNMLSTGLKPLIYEGIKTSDRK